MFIKYVFCIKYSYSTYIYDIILMKIYEKISIFNRLELLSYFIKKELLYDILFNTKVIQMTTNNNIFIDLF